MRYRTPRFFTLHRALTAAVLSIVLIATACATTGEPQSASDSSTGLSNMEQTQELAGPGTRCGTVTFASGTPGSVVVQSGAMSCTAAVALINRYFTDPSLVRQGNTNSAVFDGWTCVSPTAVAAEIAGYGTKCESNDVTLIVVPQDSGAGAPTPSGPACTAEAISADLGQPIIVPPRCYDGWAHVTWSAVGDGSGLAHIVDGKWVLYTAFPTMKCPDEARADEVPEAELGNFTMCARDPQGEATGDGAGDLGLSAPITKPTCDGLGIVVVYSATNPSTYATEVGNALAAHPGAKYLRTDESCPSLRQQSDEGNPIYAVYKPAGYSQSEVCAAVRRENDDAYGKWLDMTTDPQVIISC